MAIMNYIHQGYRPGAPPVGVKQSIWRCLPQALRIHQWSKNLLLGVPLITAHKLVDFAMWRQLFLAFFCFSFMASATYLINDLIDLHNDRLHEAKRHRPMVNGDLPIPIAVMLSCTLAVSAAVVAAFMLPLSFSCFMAGYALLTLAYSIELKKHLLIDVIALASLYTIRILAGGAATGIIVSEWLLMFALFIFFSLALLKRYIEINRYTGEESIPGRGYYASDANIIRSVGPASGLMAVLVLSFYINSPDVRPLYSQPPLLWLICPIVIYWVMRMWFLAERGQVHHDPIVHAIRDWQTYVLGALCAAIITAAAVL